MPGYLGGWHKENTNPCLEFESTNVIEVLYCEHEHFYHTIKVWKVWHRDNFSWFWCVCLSSVGKATRNIIKSILQRLTNIFASSSMI